MKLRYKTASVLAVTLMILEVTVLTGCAGGYEPISQAEIERIKRGETSAKMEVVLDAAVSLVGEVDYFWGGKSDAVGRDERWGEPADVESEGSVTTGSVRPFGLDCSGYVAWCFWQAGVPQEETGTVTYDQFDKSEEIEWSELRAGDFVFKNTSAVRENHVGICLGMLDGEPVFAHCSLSLGGVVVTRAGGVFKYARRPRAEI